MILGFNGSPRRTLCERVARGVLLSGWLFLHASSASAEDAETRTAARDLATQGAEAFEAEKYAQASDLFRRAYELVQAPSIALLQARSLAKLGQLLEAIDIYERTARWKLPEGSPEAYSQAVETARGELEGVRKRLPRLKLTLFGVAKGETPQVTIDEKPTPAALLGVERPVNPGRHQIVVRVAGEIRGSRELRLVESQISQIELLVQSADQAARARGTAPESASANAGAASRRTWGYVALGVGALGVGIGTYTGFVAIHQKSALDAACHPGCPASSAHDLASFRSNRTASWLGFSVGLAAAATGALLLTIGQAGHEQIAIRALPTGIQIGGQL